MKISPAGCHFLTSSMWVLYPPNFPQTIQYKGFTSIINKTKELASKIPTLNWLAIMRSRTEAVTIVAHGWFGVCDGCRTCL